ncbi:SRPBCC family protein [Flavitalea sp.]|nr:SRPBCC domain-containing protein [Flavitalea sp.]
MNTPDFNTSILVNQTPAEAFQAITNVRGWWSEEIVGGTAKLNDVFNYHFKDVHTCTIKLTEVVPGKKVVWHVLDNHFNFTKDNSEWKDTKIIFEISEVGNKTLVNVTHLGLVPEYECFDICSNAWTRYIRQSLFGLITTGKGQPNRSDNPQTADEKRLADSAAVGKSVN